MPLPKFLKNFNVQINGFDYKLRAEEVTLPKIKIKTEEYQASTMHGPLEVGVSMEKLEATIKLLEIPTEILLATGFSVSANGSAPFSSLLVLSLEWPCKNSS
ncbi:MAG: hypothetical protein EOP04_33465, partial [Proteobacteria bacterium]